MRPRRVPTPLYLRPGRSRILRQPLGVVGVISPWNYPFQLALLPVVAALAAGNRALLKPSEFTPQTSALLARIVALHFAADELAVVKGGAEVGQAFAQLPFDHLFFTGSTAVGRKIALAAAANLTPVTLELGGKSPALVAEDADLDAVAPRLVVGKLLNAGQTCIAPDYVLAPAGRVDALVEAIGKAVAALYPTLGANPDYTSIINERHYARLTGLVDDARRQGARALQLESRRTSCCRERARKLAPTLLVGVRDDMAVMQEEIFGPVLPIETYATLDEAIARINARPRPLALYVFGFDRRAREQRAAANGRRRRHARRHALALLQRGAAVRRRRRVGHRRVPRRARLPHVHAREGRVHAAALRADLDAQSALRQAVRGGAEGPQEAGLGALRALPPAPPERFAEHQDHEQIDDQRGEPERGHALRQRVQLEGNVDQSRHRAEPLGPDAIAPQPVALGDPHDRIRFPRRARAATG